MRNYLEKIFKSKYKTIVNTNNDEKSTKLQQRVLSKSAGSRNNIRRLTGKQAPSLLSDLIYMNESAEPQCRPSCVFGIFFNIRAAVRHVWEGRQPVFTRTSINSSKVEYTGL